MKIYIIIFSLFVPVIMLSQNDSLVQRKILIMDTEEYFSKDSGFVYIDTILSKFYDYDNSKSRDLSSLGNPGLALNRLTYHSINNNFMMEDDIFGLNFGQRGINKVYNSSIPFARISYISGPVKYQNFDVFFTKNVNSRLNFVISYNTFGSDGYYLNQESIGRNFNFQSSFRTRNRGYGYYLKYNSISGSANENGGVKSINQYDSLIQDRKLGIQVWLEQASNRYEKSKVELKQYIRLSGQDSNSTMQDAGSFLLFDNVMLVDVVSYQDSFIDSAYYDGFSLLVKDSGMLYDKCYMLGSLNKLSYKFVNKLSRIEVLAGINMDYFSVNTGRVDSTISSTGVYIDFNEIKVRNVLINGFFHHGIFGFNDSGYLFKGSALKRLWNDRVQLKLKAKISSSLPSYKSMEYRGSNISWQNSFDYVYQKEYTVSIIDDSIGFSFEALYSGTSNYVYYGRNVIPVQYYNSFTWTQLTLGKKFSVGAYHLDLNIIYQDVDGSAPLNVAKWIGKASIYYQRFLFSDAMELRYGMDYFQFSSYNADFYSPFTRSFVYQDEFTVGDYPFLNFFISARIKSAQGFVNFQNIAQLVLSQRYMMTPYYSMQDFSFSFGLKWDFYN